MRGSISVNAFSGVSLWYSPSTVAKAVRISSSAFDTPCLRRVGRNQSRIPVSKSMSVPTTSNVSVLKSRSLIASPRASSRSGYNNTRILARQTPATPTARFPQDERNLLEPPYQALQCIKQWTGHKYTSSTPVQANTEKFTCVRSSRKRLTYAGSRTLLNPSELLDPPSHGGGHEFESRRVHSQSVGFAG